MTNGSSPLQIGAVTSPTPIRSCDSIGRYDADGSSHAPLSFSIQAMTLVFGITSPYVAAAEMCEKPAFYDRNGEIKGPVSPLKNCAMPTSLVKVDA